MVLGAMYGSALRPDDFQEERNVSKVISTLIGVMSTYKYSYLKVM